jgi:hypothetical protein
MYEVLKSLLPDGIRTHDLFSIGGDDDCYTTSLGQGRNFFRYVGTNRQIGNKKFFECRKPAFVSKSKLSRSR